MRSSAALAAVAVLAAMPAAAAENVTISSAATSGGTLSGGTFTPTGDDANLNIAELKAALAVSDVAVTNGSSGSQAGDITLADKLTWPANTLVLSAFHAVRIDAKLAAKGTAGLKLKMAHGGSLTFGAGRITFASASQSFKIGARTYTLVADIPALATAISGHRAGHFALMDTYDAANGPAYSAPPIPAQFIGDFEGLGNRILNLTVTTNSTSQKEALFARLGPNGTIEDLGLVNASIHNSSGLTTAVAALAVNSDGAIRNVSVSGQVSQSGNGEIGGLVAVNGGAIVASSSGASVAGTSDGADLGGLVGTNNGTISNSSATGAVSSPAGLSAGGLVALNEGMIFQSFATGNVSCGQYCDVGGLVGYNNNGGNIDQTYATGDVSGGDGSETGGLVGFSVFDFTPNAITNSYARGAVTADGAGTALSDPRVGGFIGTNSTTAISASYSTGAPSATGTSPLVGGFVGEDDAATGANTNDYWNKTTSGITNPSQGAGDPANDPGITGLTAAQMRAGLPAGFDSAIWAETAGVNFGLPYLIALPPR